ncbi:hypothetical protein HPL003_00425 [Paenibacillus terrae HPL-003]|uniref:YCII-related domain-containing protein n=1 Tax=Paenibacillus terrae (strain HPL-003) TaxID=985665 RepID=G7VTI8_PAETH|nr:YciI family protein [Paenibacillus terrae]AET56871.1 hypothetical protein HPL003_00425 [Paenibacillus terrae HPL-003]
MKNQLIITNLSKELPDDPALLTQHMEYFKNLAENGKFLLVGTGDFNGIGGIYVAVTSNEEAKVIIQNEPLFLGGYMNYTITEIDVAFSYPELEELLK